MKKTLALLTLAVVALAAPAFAAITYWSESQTAAGRAAPTPGSTEGLPLGSARGLRVTVCAASGNTLAGAGSVHIYYQDPQDLLWKRNPGLDLAISVTATACAGAACRCQAFPDLNVATYSVGGRVLGAASGITLSAGTNVTVSIHATP